MISMLANDIAAKQQAAKDHIEALKHFLEKAHACVIRR